MMDGYQTVDIVLKGEIPTEAEFARLLCDKTFADYFNTFLSLPVFAQRLLYKFKEQTFELDPPLKKTKYRLDRVKLMRWVRTQRAPLFFKTDLYLEYLLCKALQRTQLLIHATINDHHNAKDRMMDHRLMSRWLGRVSGMNRFRRFLAQTTGERSLAFWLDAERFRKSANDDDDEHRTLFRQMEAKYFKFGASMELPEHAKWPAFSTRDHVDSKPESPNSALAPKGQRRQSYFVGGGVEVETPLPCGSLFGDHHVRRDAFVVIQGFILKTLQNYWVPRFIIHCKTRWSRGQLAYETMFLKDSNALGPQWYTTKVRSLSELSDGGVEEEDASKSSHLLLGCGTKKLQKQSMSNLMAMFSSRGLRNSDLNALLKMEDTGEKVGTVSGETYDSGWLVDEFPLSSISEESHVSSSSRSASHSVVSSRAATPISPDSNGGASERKTPEPRKKPGSSRKAHSGKRPSRTRVRRSGTRTKSPLAHEEHGVQQDAVPAIELTEVQDQEQPSIPDDEAETGLFADEPPKPEPKKEVSEKHEGEPEEALASDVQKQTDDSVDDTNAAAIELDKKPSDTEDALDVKLDEIEHDHKGTDTRRHSISSDTEGALEDDKGRYTPSFHHSRRRRSSTVTPISGRTSSNTSVSHGSNTSIASLAGSKRRVSVIASGPKPKPPPQRRARSMSVEFRLADFSMLMTTLDSTGGEKGPKAEEMLPQLEADLQALKAHQENEEKKKEEEKLKKKGRRMRLKAIAGGQKASSKGKKGKQQNLKGKQAPRKKLVKLTQLNLARFDALLSGRHIYSPMSPFHTHTTVFHDIIQPEGTGSSLDASLKKKQKEFEKKDYAKLSFEQKLEHDDFKLSTIPRVSSPLPPLKSQSSSSSSSSTKTSTKDSSSISQYVKLPKLEAKPPSVVPKAGMNISKPSYCGYNLGEPNYRHRHKVLVGAVAADKLAGSPFEKYLNRQNQVTDINYLQFWQISQEYLTTAAYYSDLEGICFRQRLAQNVIATFLTQSGDKFITLGEGLTEELKKQLPGNTGDELLTHAQDLACEAMRDSWEAYRKHDQDEFLTRTTSRKPFADVLSRRPTKSSSYPFPIGIPAKHGAEEPTPAPDAGQRMVQLAMENARKLGTEDAKAKKVDEDVNAIASYRMWKSLHLAQWTSRLNPESAELSDPSDPESDSDDEGSLRRKPIVVVRKRKVKPQVDIIRSWTPSLELKRIKFEREEFVPPKEKEIPTFEQVAKTVCKAIRKDGKTIHRPPRPRTFQEVLRDSSHLEFFKRFMIREKADTPLQFWQTVENMRKTCRDAKSRQSKTIMIIRKFFNKSTDYGGALQCDADIIMDIPNMEKVTPQMLLSAQACVARSMEEKWFAMYQDTFPEESPPPEKATIDESTSQPKIVPREKNKALWGMFIHNVISFRRGLMNPITLNLFKSYLGLEVSKEIEKQKQTGTQSKRMISNKVVIVDRLGNDLGFWAEVERFKDLADSAAAAAAAGTYTLEDEEYVQQKAKAIIDCYIDSQIPPKLQINIPQELADEIMDTAQNGLIERGLFHDAAVSTFTVLLYCWKKFCRERFAPPPEKKARTSPAKPKKKRKKKKAPSTPLVCGVKIKTIIGQNVEEPPRMQFTLQHGIQLVLPPKPPKVEEEKQTEHIKRVMRQLYPHVGDVFRHGEERLVQLYHQLIQQHGPQGIQSLLQKRRFSQFRTLGNTPLPFARYFNPQAQIP